MGSEIPRVSVAPSKRVVGRRAVSWRVRTLQNDGCNKHAIDRPVSRGAPRKSIQALAPEYGRQLYAPPRGGAIVFSCSLLHKATAVTREKRYAYVPFLYDEAGERIRKENARFVDEDATSRS